MRKLFCRIGSKTKISKIVLNLIPEHKIYVEPFVGGAAIYFAIKKPEGIVEVLNDLDKGLMESYALVKKAELPTQADITRLNKYNKSKETLTKFYQSAGGSSLDKLGKAIIKYCYTYSGKGYGNAYDKGDFTTKLLKLSDYKERMKNTILHNWDYIKIIKKYDSKDTFLYIDPPYENSEVLYDHHFIDIPQMAHILKNIKGKFLLSLNYNPELKPLFSGFNIKVINVKSQSNSNGDIGKDRKEFLISNY